MKVSKKKLVIAGLLALGVISTLAFVKVSGPAEGVISYPDNRSQSGNELNKNFVRYDGQKISFSYPEGWRFEKRQEQSQSITESYFLVASAKGRNPSYTVGVSAYRLPDGGLAEDGAYKIRVNDPKTYQKSIEQVDGREVIYFKNQNATENTAFIKNGPLVATVSLSGSLLSEEANQAFNHIVESLQWL